MPTGLLPVPLRVGGSTARIQSGGQTRCLPLEAPLPLGVLWAQIGRRCAMAYVIAEPCIGTKDTACVDACPVDCIHPKKNTTYNDGRPGFDAIFQLYIDPVECIDCGACVPVGPVSAIFALDDLPEKWKHYAELNANYVQSGKLTPGEYTKYAAK